VDDDDGMGGDTIATDRDESGEELDKAYSLMLRRKIVALLCASIFLA